MTKSNENQRTITLPTIPKEVADALEYLRSHGMTNERIIELIGAGSPTEDIAVIGRWVYGEQSFDMLLSALVNGYVVEKSAEEETYDKIREEYEHHYGWARTDHRHDGFADGIIFTLDTLGIKIEGVNA